MFFELFLVHFYLSLQQEKKFSLFFIEIGKP